MEDPPSALDEAAQYLEEKTSSRYSFGGDKDRRCHSETLTGPVTGKPGQVRKVRARLQSVAAGPPIVPQPLHD
jgi:hypothetical protein